jgi:S1-C subfamily serine protease
MLAAIAALLCCSPLASALADMKTYQQSVHSAVLIENSNSSGTGALLDVNRRIVVTAAHVVRGEDAVNVMFPQFKNGRIVQDKQAYVAESANLTIGGHVIWSDERRDIAVIQLDSVPADAVAMPLAAESAQPGEALFAIGNSTVEYGALFNYLMGQVRAVYSYKDEGFRVVDTNIAVNHGDSGGPLVNDRGELVGVASYFLSDQNTRSHFIDIADIRLALKCAELLGVSGQ